MTRNYEELTPEERRRYGFMKLTKQVIRTITSKKRLQRWRSSK